MEFREIIFGSPQYEEAIKLRNRILRNPLGIELDEKSLAEENKQLHFGLYDETGLKSCVLIQPFKDTHAKLRQMAVADDTQGKGYGSTMVDEVEHYLKGIGMTEIILHARVSAVGFYEKKGYTVFGEEFQEVGIPHLKMKKQFELPIQKILK